MRSLRILLGCAQPPGPESSAAGRWCYALLRGLAARGHRVTAFVACQRAEDARAIGEYLPARDYDIRCFPTPPPRSGMAQRLNTLRRPHSYPFGPEMMNQWRAESRSGYDIVHVEEIWSAWLAQPAPNTVLHIHNLYRIDWPADSGGSAAEKMRRLLTTHTEGRLIRRFPTIVVASTALASEVARMAPRSRVHVAPLALDLDGYGFVPRERRTADPVVAMIGSMDWPPSRSAAERLLERLWPAIRRELPQARLQITGRHARTALRNYLSHPGVEIHEDVASTKPYFEKAAVLLYAPERGSGMKVKVLESFAYGLPVVTTRAGVEGLEAEDGVHAGIHETDEGLLARVFGLLRDPARQEAQRCAARHLLETRYTPASSVERLESVYATVLERQMSRADAAASEPYADRC